jgi:plasmid stabilization system protein ParE
MPAQVIYSLIAIRELEQSSDWYEEQSIGLGKRFVKTIRDTLLTTSANPEAFPKTKGNFRQVVIKDFPFIIIFRYNRVENVMYILHVFHTSRNPKLKYKIRS